MPPAKMLQKFHQWPLRKVAIATLVFCVGAWILVSSYEPAYEGHSGLSSSSPRYAYGASIHPFPFALGLGICIVSGVVLLKEIREYIK